MAKLFVLALAGACGIAQAQTPATNPMPDGSRDMYVGLGAQYAPRYEGARDRRATALPMLQVQWSNGVFVSGMSLQASRLLGDARKSPLVERPTNVSVSTALVYRF